MKTIILFACMCLMAVYAHPTLGGLGAIVDVAANIGAGGAGDLGSGGLPCGGNVLGGDGAGLGGASGLTDAAGGLVQADVDAKLGLVNGVANSVGGNDNGGCSSCD